MRCSPHDSTSLSRQRHRDRSWRSCLGSAAILWAAALGACDNAPASEDPPTPTFTLREELRIGADSTSPAYELSDIRQLAVHAGSGSLFVVQGRLNDVRVFSSDGGYSHSVGRLGSGPGEFRSISAMGFHGDTLWTIDNELRRVSLFRPNGSLISSWQVDSEPINFAEVAHARYTYPTALLSDRSMLGFGASVMRAIDVGDITSWPILSLTPAGRTRDTLAWVPIGNAHLSIHAPGRGTTYRAQPFGDEPLRVYAPKSSRAYVVERYAALVAGDNRYAATAISARGDSLWRREVTYEPRPLSKGIADSVRTRYVRAYSAQFPVEAIERALYLPAHWSPITEVTAGDDGTLWLRREDDTSGVRFDVLDGEGTMRRQVLAPPRMRLRWAADRTVWGFTLDDDDVPSLVRYRIMPDST